MAIIKNSDYSIGTVKRLNQYEMDSDLAQKYRYLELKNQTSNYEHRAKSISLRNLPREGKHIPKNLPANFNDKLQTFEFAPPSDNLWNITIQPSRAQMIGDIDTSNQNLFQLYKNITSVNQTWASNRAEGWQVSLNQAKNTSKQTAENFIKQFCDNELGVFLAQKVNFTPMSVNYDSDTFGIIQQQGGFFKNAKIVKSRKNDDNLKINFLISNWDLSEILIDPWIAAISQHGLIADGLTLKAKIIITEYSASHPKFTDSEEYDGMMTARKQYVFDGCFPVSRDETSKSYELNEAGTYKNSVVNFVYDNYQINYLF